MMIIGTFLKFLFQNRHKFRAMQASVSDGQFRRILLKNST